MPLPCSASVHFDPCPPEPSRQILPSGDLQVCISAAVRIERYRFVLVLPQILQRATAALPKLPLCEAFQGCDRSPVRSSVLFAYSGVQLVYLSLATYKCVLKGEEHVT